MSFILVLIICGAALTIEVTLPLFMKITTNMGPVFEIRGGQGVFMLSKGAQEFNFL